MQLLSLGEGAAEATLMSAEGENEESGEKAEDLVWLNHVIQITNHNKQ
jgi:hypothetical protein